MQQQLSFSDYESTRSSRAGHRASGLGSAVVGATEGIGNLSGRYASAFCQAYDYKGAVEEVCSKLRADLDGKSPDLLIAFVASPMHPPFDDVLPKILHELDPKVVVGCSAFGVIGAGKEYEEGPGLSILASRCDVSGMHPFFFDDTDARGENVSPDSLIEVVGAAPEEFADGSMLVFVDPLTVSTDNALSMLDSAYPTVKKVGALVSGGFEYRENRLLLGDRARNQGVAGLMMKENISIDTMFAGSETPVGDEMVITSSNKNVIYKLGTDTPMSVLQQVFEKANPRDQARMESSLVVGLDTTGVISEGGYLMRNIISMDGETGHMEIGDLVEDGQVMRFHVRNHREAAARLGSKVREYAELRRSRGSGIDAMLSFNSMARGSRMFREDDHDAKVIIGGFGYVPTAGFFSNGEIVSSKGGFAALGDTEEYVTRVMGYTHTMAMLREIGSGKS